MKAFLKPLERKLMAQPTVAALLQTLATPKGFLILLALMGALFMLRPSAHPVADRADMAAAYVPYRMAVYNDYKYQLAFSDSLNAGEVRKYPPIMSSMLRGWWHKSVGNSAASSHIFSGLLMLVLAGLFGMLAYKRSHGDWGRANLALACIGFAPATVMAARTAGAVQEIVFLGGLSLLLPLLFARADNRGLSRILWVSAGLCAAWAAASQMWGLLFLLVPLASFALMPAAWRAEDGLHGAERPLWFMLGGILPAVAVYFQLFGGAPDFAETIRQLCDLYKQQHFAITQSLFAQHGVTLDPASAGGKAVGGVLQLNASGNAATFAPLGFLFQILFWGFVAALIANLFTRALPLHVRLFVLLGVLSALMALLYMSAPLQVVYAGIFVVAGAVMLLQARESPWLESAVRLQALFCAVFAAAYLGFLVFGGQGYVGQQKIHDALLELNAATGLNNVKVGTTYVDEATWPAGDGTTKPYADIFRGLKPELPKAFIVNPDAYDATPKDDSKSRLLMDEAFKLFVLRAIVAVEGTGQGYYHLMQTGQEDPLLVTLFDAKGSVHKMRGSYRDLVPLRTELAPRWYLLLTPPAVPMNLGEIEKSHDFSIHYARTGRSMVSVAIVEVRKAMTLAQADERIILIPLTEGWGK